MNKIELPSESILKLFFDLVNKDTTYCYEAAENTEYDSFKDGFEAALMYANNEINQNV